MNGNNNKCKGCHSREVDNCIFLIPPYRYEAEIDNCPCMICIVKMVCTKKCEARSEFYLHSSIALPSKEISK